MQRRPRWVAVQFGDRRTKNETRGATTLGESPETFAGEGVSGTGFQVALKSRCLRLRRESQISLQSPRSVGCRADVLPRVVLNHTPLQVAGSPDVAFLRRRFASQQIDVVHRSSMLLLVGANPMAVEKDPSPNFGVDPAFRLFIKEWGHAAENQTACLLRC